MNKYQDALNEIKRIPYEDKELSEYKMICGYSVNYSLETLQELIYYMEYAQQFTLPNHARLYYENQELKKKLDIAYEMMSNYDEYHYEKEWYENQVLENYERWYELEQN